VQGAKPEASRLQTKVEPASLLVNMNDADPVVASAGGPEATVVSGATVSTVQSYVVAGPVLPNWEARTANVCGPSARSVKRTGLVQAE